MKVALLFLVGLVATSFAFETTRKIEFQPGKTYVYNYRTQLTTGIPELNQQYAGLWLKSRIVWQPLDTERVIMKLDQVRGSQLNYLETVDLPNELPTESLEVLERYLSKPIEARYISGKVQSFSASNEEPEWSLNIKRAVLSLMSVDLTPKKVIRSHAQKINESPVDLAELTYYGVYENTVVGRCETLYEIKQIVDPRSHHAVKETGLNVTKVINYSRCTEEAALVNANLETQGCNAYCTYNKQFNGRVELKGYYPIDQNSDKKPEFVKTACDCSMLDMEMPVDQFTTIKYNISTEEKVIESIRADGQTILNKGHEKMSVATVSTLELVDISRSSNDNIHVESNVNKHDLVYRLTKETAEEAQMNLDIPYYSLFKFPDQEKIVSVVKRSINTVVENIITENDLKSKNTGEELLSIVDSMAVLKTEYLKKLYKSLVSKELKSLKDQTTRKIFLDCLALTGTNDAAKVIYEAIHNGEVAYPEVHELLEALPNNMYYPSKSTIDNFMSLIESGKYLKDKVDLHVVVTNAVSKMIKKGCDRLEPAFVRKSHANGVSHPRSLARNVEETTAETVERCNSAHVKQYVRQFAKLLTESNEFITKFAYVEALAQIGHPLALSILEPYVSGKISAHRCPGYETTVQREECDYLRTHVIYALHKFAAQYPAQVRAMAMTVYRDVNEAHEIRVAALTLVMFSNPSKFELQSIADSMRRENNRQIVAMTYSYLKQTSKLTYPKYQEVAQAAQEILATIPEVELHGYSKVFMKDVVHPVNREGIFGHYQYTKSNYTAMPTSFYLALGRMSPTSHKPTVTFAYSAKGFENFVTKLYTEWANGFSGEWEKILPEVLKYRTQSPETESTLKEISEKLHLKIRESPEFKFKMSYQLFDNAGTHFFDETLLRQTLERYVKNALKMSEKLRAGETLQFVKIFMPVSYNKMNVNMLGMPVVVRQRSPLLVALKMHTLPSVRSEATLALKVHPTVLNVEVTEITTPIYSIIGKQVGTKVTKQTYFDLPLKFVLAVEPFQRKMVLSVITERKSNILVYETRPVTYVKDSVLIMNSAQQHREDERLIRVLPVPSKLVKVFGEMPFGYGFEMESNRDVTTMAEEQMNAATFNPLVFNELVQYWTAQWINNGNGYVLKKFSIKADEIEQPVYHFAIKYDRVANFPKYDQDYKLYSEAKKAYQSLIQSTRENTEAAEYTNQLIEYDNEYKSILANDRTATKSEAVLSKLDRIIAKLDLDKDTLIKKINEMIGNSVSVWKANRQHDQHPAVDAHNIVLVIMSHSQMWKQMGLNAIYARTMDSQISWFKMDGFVRFGELFNIKYDKTAEQYQQFCVEKVMSWPKMSDIFHARQYMANEDAQEQKQGALKTFFSWGKQTCTDGKVVISGLLRHVSTEKLFQSQNNEQNKDYTDATQNNRDMPWFSKQCLEDMKQNKEATLACEMAVKQLTKINHVDLDIKYTNVPAYLLNLTTKLETALKAKYWRFMDLNSVNVRNADNRIKVSASYSEKIKGIPLLNLYVQKPNEQVSFERITVPFRSVVSKMSQYNFQDRCMIVDHQVRTFDNVTYNMPESRCRYLIAMDCSEQQRFAVYAQQQDDGKIITVLARGKVIEVHPFKQHDYAKIFVDKKEFELRLEHPFAFRDLKVYLRHIESETTKALVIVEVANELKISTDSNNVEIKTHPRFTGLTCGLCGNKDYETEQEFEAANQCEYKLAEDFAWSYAIKSGECSVPEARGPMRCTKSSTQRHESANDTKKNLEISEDCMHKKTYVTYRKDKTCFSKMPVNQCRKGCRGQSQTEKRTAFVCYPSNDAFTKQMVQSAEVRVLSELNTDRVSFEETLTVPTVCDLTN